jgi:hypothetical protein
MNKKDDNIIVPIVILEFSWITTSLNQDALNIIWFIETWERFLTNNASVSVTSRAILHLQVLHDETYLALAKKTVKRKLVFGFMVT